MTVTLETLDLTPEEREASKDLVRHRAYFSWLDAGQPRDQQLDCWLAAERHWIEHDYVPHRALDGTRPATEVREPSSDAPPTKESGRRAHMLHK